jgi:DnaJ-class molecular chaperone
MKCRNCNGQGHMYLSYADLMDYRTMPCPGCGGTGREPEETREQDEFDGDPAPWGKNDPR